MRSPVFAVVEIENADGVQRLRVTDVYTGELLRRDNSEALKEFIRDASVGDYHDGDTLVFRIE